MQSKLISYLESQRREASWDMFLLPLFQEFAAALGPDELRSLLVRAGMLAGRNMPLSACESVAQLEIAANQHWAERGWGVVTITEREDCLEIVHEAVPPGVIAKGGLAAFLEGVYQQWFVSLGAGSTLLVRQYQSTEPGVFLYRFEA